MINVLISSLSRDFGGVESLFLTLCQNCEKHNVHFDFLCSDKSAAREDDFLATGAKVYHLPQPGKNMVAYCKAFNKILKNGNYQVFHVNMTRYKFPLELILAKSYGLKVILHSHATQIYKTGNLKTKIIRIIEQRLFRPIALANSDLNIACCKTAGKYLFKKENYTIIYNGIELEKFVYNADVRTTVRKELGIDQKTKVIGHIGRFSDEKNHKFLLNIFKKVHEEDSNVKLLCVGDGNLYEQIRGQSKQQGVSDAVVFTGQRKDIPNLLSTMDLFVLPSKHEAFPITLIEAQANGLKCIVSDCVTKEIDVCGMIDFLQLKRNSDEWKKVIEKQLTVRENCVESQKNELNKFDIEYMFEELCAIYEKGEVKCR